MTFDKSEITYLVKNKQKFLGGIIFHNETGVNFSYDFDFENNESIFKVSDFDGNEPTNVQEFSSENRESFFNAVDEFERRISEQSDKQQQQQQKSEPPSSGQFFLNREGLISKIKAFGQEIPVNNKELKDIFSPPKTKKYGQLDLLSSDNPKYDPVKSKWALNFNKEATQQNKAEGKSGIVYDMIPYTSDPENQEPMPNSNEEKGMSLNDIENESQENLEGNPNSQGEPEKEPTGESQGKPESGQGEPTGESQGQPESGQGEPQEGQGEPQEGQGEPQESQSGTNKGQLNETSSVDSDAMDEKLKATPSEDDKSIVNLQSVKDIYGDLNTYFEGASEEKMKIWYDYFNQPSTVSKEDFIKELNNKL